MTRLLEMLVASTPLFCVIAAMNNILIVLSTVLCTQTIFNIKARKKPLAYILSLLTVSVCTALEVIENHAAVDSVVLSVVVVLMPFLCILILFPLNAVWKGFAVSLGYNLVEAAKYLILMLFFEYDLDVGNPGAELFADTVVTILTFIIIAGFFIRRSRKRSSGSVIAKINPLLYLFIIATTVVFFTTLILLGINYSEGQKTGFVFIFLNIPLFGVTIAYAVSSVLRSRLSEESYKAQLDMQLRHYEILERKNEEMRMFRHDLPKKLRPLGAYIREGKTEEAEKILYDFNVSVENSRPRYQSGNFRFDTVLECQQQIAEKDGINIVLTFGSVFPENGIEPDDIYTIFPNALDNAIEACRKTDGKREITVTSRIRSGTVLVTITNPASDKLIAKNGMLETTKGDTDNHGYGFRSIKKAAGKYGSDNVDYVVESGLFTLRMDLKFDSRE
ncbi:MAG: ATP-binding protein [Clostridia bacterium]|nr:ATP-binding protein [Clostridia bacterium]